MSPMEEMQERFSQLAKALAKEQQVNVGGQRGKGFGSSALQVGGKIFAMVSSDGEFVLKLPKHRVQELEVAGIGRRFNPGHGRLMKEWLVLDVTRADLLPVAREALQYVRDQL